jgi:tetratricopeptide (TPR) repeat protein
MGAAVIAMKVAVDFGRLDLLHAIYHEIEPHFGSDEVSKLHCIEATTIYRTMCDPSTVEIEELNRLVELGHTLGGELGYHRAIRTATNACRLSGRYYEGLEFASRALEHADTNRFYSKRREILMWIIALHMAAGEFRDARRVLTAIITDAFPSDSAQARNEIVLLDARIAIEEGDFQRAATLFQQAQPVSPTYSLARKCYCVALEVQIRVSQKVDSRKLNTLVAELEAYNIALRPSMARDFESYSLFVGLRHLGEEARARASLQEYVNQRRDKWPLSARIREALGRPQDGGIVTQVELNQETAARKTVPLSGVL